MRYLHPGQQGMRLYPPLKNWYPPKRGPELILRPSGAPVGFRGSLAFPRIISNQSVSFKSVGKTVYCGVCVGPSCLL
jgi:hypothetical protein